MIHYAEIAVAPVDAPRAAATFTGLVCGRVYYAAGHGLRLLSAQDALGASADARADGSAEPSVYIEDAMSPGSPLVVAARRASPTGRTITF